MRKEKYTDMSLTDEQAALLGFKSFSEPEQYIQVKDVRYTLDEFNRIGDYLLGRKLTDDQQVVLEWLKGIAGNDGSLIKAVYNLYHLNLARSEIFKGNEKLAKVRTALRRLTRQQEVEVLAAFAEWGSKEEQS
ncbi:hypothetical protein EsVE80_21850 [Enterococcus saigonensis]|uniref:Uncharacterized protein n=1 Tax=Enterococcus saigonensis TaxID=1805431 RepID=A0A679IKH8_9ENTE|nr:hypothetical protein [Enterococcus saigonensis]BCA86662.1 hypothetical protein EsVE80_21850 [Enterococcus saigonensis]